MLIIRRASEADVCALVSLKASLHSLHVAQRPDFFKAMTHDDLVAWLRERLANAATHVWMAEEESKVIGYLLATQREREETSYSAPRRWCEIDEVAVESSSRRRGIARALIERAVVQAREVGLDSVELSTWAFNESAQAAFGCVGFQPMLVRYELTT
jgi:shikimate dehydrogenase